MKIKKLQLVFILFFYALGAQAQININSSVSANDLINDLLDTTGSTLSVSNVILNCDSTAFGIFTGPSNIGLDNGIVLASGTANSMLYGSLNGNSDSLGTNGDSDLSIIAQVNTHDACVLEFDFTPFGDTLIYSYVFTSREYPSFNCTMFNDVFAFFISGLGYTGLSNVALLPNSTIPVSIRTVNDGTGGSCGDTNFFVKNQDTFLNTQGFTTPLFVKAPVSNGQQYHLKIAIADASDAILNSHVFLGRKSLFCKSAKPSSLKSSILDKDIMVYPTAFENSLYVKDIYKKIRNYQIFTIEGKLIQKKVISQPSERLAISLSILNSGNYLIKFEGERNATLGSTRVFKK